MQEKLKKKEKLEKKKLLKRYREHLNDLSVFFPENDRTLSIAEKELKHFKIEIPDFFSKLIKSIDLKEDLIDECKKRGVCPRCNNPVEDDLKKQKIFCSGDHQKNFNSSGRLKSLRDDQVDFAGFLAQHKRILQHFIKKIEIEPDQDPFTLFNLDIHPDLLPTLPDQFELELFSELFNQQFELAQELFDQFSEEEREVIPDEFTYPFRSTEQIFSENISKVFSPNTSNVLRFTISKNILFDLFSIEDMIKSCLNTKQEMLLKESQSQGAKKALIAREKRSVLEDVDVSEEEKDAAYYAEKNKKESEGKTVYLFENGKLKKAIVA